MDAEYIRRNQVNFIHSSFLEFIKLWHDHQEATFTVKCSSGKAVVSFDSSLDKQTDIVRQRHTQNERQSEKDRAREANRQTVMETETIRQKNRQTNLATKKLKEAKNENKQTSQEICSRLQPSPPRRKRGCFTFRILNPLANNLCKLETFGVTFSSLADAENTCF